MSIADLQAQIDCLTLELEVRRTPAAPSEEPSSASTTFGHRVVEAPEEPAESHGSLSWDRRLELARCTGDFFVHCMEGTNRGSSGQNQVGLPKRVYVLVRDNGATSSEGPFRSSPATVISSHSLSWAPGSGTRSLPGSPLIERREKPSVAESRLEDILGPDLGL